MKILLICDAIVPTLKAIGLKPLKDMTREKENLSWRYVPTSRVTVKDLIDADVVWLVRMYGTIAESIALTSRILGKQVVLDLDDNFGRLPVYSELEVDVSRIEISKSIRRIAEVASLVRVYSDQMLMDLPLKQVEKCRTWVSGKDPKFAKELSPSLKASEGELQKPKLKLVYPSSNSFNQEILNFFNEALIELSREFDVTFVTFQRSIWTKKEITNTARVINLKPSLGYRAFQRKLQRHNDGIGLAPMIDSAFFRSKTPAKYRDMALAGLPAVYSNVPPYSQIVKERMTGFLVTNTAEEWAKAVTIVVKNSILRESIRLAAFEEAKERYSYESFMDELRGQLDRLMMTKSQKSLESKGRNHERAFLKDSLLFTIRMTSERMEDRRFLKRNASTWTCEQKNRRTIFKEHVYFIDCTHEDLQVLLLAKKNRLLVLHNMNCKCKIRKDESYPSFKNYADVYCSQDETTDLYGDHFVLSCFLALSEFKFTLRNRADSQIERDYFRVVKGFLRKIEYLYWTKIAPN